MQLPVHANHTCSNPVGCHHPCRFPDAACLLLPPYRPFLPPALPPPPAVLQIANTMQLFEKQFENLDLQTQVVEGVMSEQAAMSTPEDEVTALMQQVADEHGLEVQIGLPGAATAVAAPAAAAAEPDLNARLAELKGAR